MTPPEEKKLPLKLFFYAFEWLKTTDMAKQVWLDDKEALLVSWLFIFWVSGVQDCEILAK